MTVDFLINAIVNQTTVLVAQLATSRGIRAPLAQIADRVFLDLVSELERQRVSRKVSADMFGLGLRTYRRKIQRLSESATDRGRSLWEAVLDYLRARASATRTEVLQRFSGDDESQVKAVLHDLCESKMVKVLGSGAGAVYRAVGSEELVSLLHGRGEEGLDELLLSLIFREPPLPADEIARRSRLDTDKVESALNRLIEEGRVERLVRDGVPHYQAATLLVPLGAVAGWEAAVFDHFKALVSTVVARLRHDRAAPALADQIGGSTFTMSVWPGHPLASEVYGTLGRIRAELSELRARVATVNREGGVPVAHDRVVVYLGQCVVHEGSESTDEVS